MILLIAAGCAPIRDPLVVACGVPEQTAWWQPDGGTSEEVTGLLGHAPAEADAVLTLTESGTLTLGAGSFYGSVWVDSAVTATVSGCGEESTTLHAGWGPEEHPYTLLVQHEEAALYVEALTLQGSGDRTRAAFLVQSGALSLNQVTVQGWDVNSAIFDGALSLAGVTLTDNAGDHQLSAANSTMYITGSALTDSTFTYTAINLDSGSLTLSGSVLSGLTAATAVLSLNQVTAALTDVLLGNNTAPAVIQSAGSEVTCDGVVLGDDTQILSGDDETADCPVE